MYGTPVFQVSPQGNSEPLDSLSFFSNSVEVAQGLGRMFMAAVTGIYHGDASIVGNHSGSSFPGVPDHDKIGIAPDHLRHISDAFAFGQRRGADVHGSYDLTSKSEHGSLEG